MSTDQPSENFASLFETQARQEGPQKARSLALGQPCRAEVVQVGRDHVFVELLDRSTLGKRPQAYIHITDVRAPDGQVGIKVGDVIEAVVVEVDAQSGEVRLGRTMGRPAGVEELMNAHAARLPVEGKVTAVNKGGLEVEVASLRAFCPTSQIDRGFVADPQALVGRALLFLVTEVRDGGKRVVVSRRALLEQEAKVSAARTLSQLSVGSNVRGTVSAVREFGVFVDLGGIEGLVPNSEVSYDRSAKTSELLSAGDVVDVQVREIKEGVVDKRGAPVTKITLSLKALTADPWDNLASVAPEGKVVSGTVTRLADFGAFVRLAPGVEGLLHISELGGKVVHPSALLKVGETLHVVVRSVDRAAHKISLVPAPDGLSVGAAAQTPSLMVGAVVSCTVDHVETFGVFLQVEGTRGRAGRGLVPNTELGTARGADTRKLFPPGKKLIAKVLETGEGKLRLSVKAIKADEERADFDGYRASSGAGGKLGTLGDLFSRKK